MKQYFLITTNEVDKIDLDKITQELVLRTSYNIIAVEEMNLTEYKSKEDK